MCIIFNKETGDHWPKAKHHTNPWLVN